jgi:plastocyanin
MRREAGRYALLLSVLAGASTFSVTAATAAHGAVVQSGHRRPPSRAHKIPPQPRPGHHRTIPTHPSAHPAVASQPVPTTTVEPPTPAEPATADLALEDNRFVPAVLTVQRNTTVVMTNAGAALHDARVSGAFTSPYLSPGETFTYTFARTGRYTLVCSVHRLEGMTASVVVQ